MRIAVLFGLFLLPQLLFAKLIFAPLPMEKAQNVYMQYRPVALFLQDILQEEVAISYYSDYARLLGAFMAEEVDIALLGPLPLAKLYGDYDAARPILRFFNENERLSYRCCLVAKKEHTTSHFAAINHVALTQPLSTCGYLMSEVMLQQHGKTLAKLPYRYTGSHINSALDVILGRSDIGGLQCSIAKRYLFHGLEIVATSKELPSFALVINSTTVSGAKAQMITEAILNAYKKDTIHQSWGSHFRYGVARTDISEYSLIFEALKRSKFEKKLDAELGHNAY